MFQENIDLGGDGNVFMKCRLKKFGSRFINRRIDYQQITGIQNIGIMSAKLKGYREIGELRDAGFQLFPPFLIGNRYASPLLGQPPGDTDTTAKASQPHDDDAFATNIIA
jgi:hypothetical protein